jgi:hypothetical protein
MLLRKGCVLFGAYKMRDGNKINKILQLIAVFER